MNGFPDRLEKLGGNSLALEHIPLDTRLHYVFGLTKGD